MGGNNEKWENILEKIGQKHVKHLNPPLDGEDMGELEYVIKKLHRFNCPITLNPQDSTFLDVAVWSYFQKRLSISTIEKRLRYARFMENHPMPVDFRNPSYENFIRHMDYREEIENVTSQALRHEWKTMVMFLRAFGIVDEWINYRAPHYSPSDDIDIPYSETVNKFSIISILRTNMKQSSINTYFS